MVWGDMDHGDVARLANLNLLPVLRSLLRHRSVTRAAEELNLTQAAVSNSLRRLRALFEDPLLIRVGRRMQPTERALALIEPVETAMAAVTHVLGGRRFDPATSNLRFRIATADYVAALIAPTIARILAAEAPTVGVQTVPARRASADALRSGQVDLIIGPKQILAAGSDHPASDSAEFRIEPLISEPMVCIGAAGDEELARGLSTEAYLARPHAVFSLDLDVQASVEALHLREQGLRQVERLICADFSTLPLIVAASDCLAIVPSSVAHLFAHLPIRAVRPPIDVPPMELVAAWHRRREDDPPLAWLRGAVSRALSPSRTAVSP